jgi:hypothetical protein
MRWGNKHRDVEYNRKIKNRNREVVKQHLLKNPCVDCGETDIAILEFDHRVPAEKRFNIAGNYIRSLPALFREISKCDVRCVRCHRRRTRKERHFLGVKRLKVETQQAEEQLSLF